ncbi:unnamed protein product [Vicia faba]|uniref:GRF-type domain-containing protein n=1 Tax=Vicia faba TaxID=3906 RepID=A0AAV1AIP4_VICFA|nr:unnamed protein product [Vicia faba]
MAQLCSKGINQRVEKSNSLVSSASYSRIKSICLYGSKSMIRLVKKKGINLGKLFWGCRYFKSEDDNHGCNFFLWYKHQRNDESKPEIQYTAFSKCSKCDEKNVQIKMLRRDDNYNKDMMNNLFKMFKMSSIPTLFLSDLPLLLFLFLGVSSGRSSSPGRASFDSFETTSGWASVGSFETTSGWAPVGSFDTTLGWASGRVTSISGWEIG